MGNLLKKDRGSFRIVNDGNSLDKTKYQKLSVNDLYYGNYQRNLSPRWVNKIVKNFKEGLLGVLIVNYRDNKYYVLDGQHRLEAAKIMNLDSVVCQIHNGLSYEEEANLFREYNKQRKGLIATDMFKAALEANDFEAHDIKRLVEKNGFKLNFYKAKCDNNIIAIATLKHIYKNIKAEGLDRMLRLLRKTWEGERASLERNFLNGMYFFIKLYGDDFTDNNFIEKLKKISPSLIFREGQQDAKFATYCRAMTPYAKTIWYHYNYKRGAKTKLLNKF